MEIMDLIALACLGVGAAFSLVGAIWLLVRAFQVSVLWGLGVIFVGPIVGLIFIILHFDKAWKPLAMEIGGTLLVAVGVMMGGLGHSATKTFGNTASQIGGS